MSLQFSSLRSRILVLVTLPLAALLASLMWISHRTTTEVVEATAEERLVSAESVLREQVESRRKALLAQARITAADPRFFATFSVPDAERGDEFDRTMSLIAEEFLQITDAHFIEIHDQAGQPVLRVDRDGETPHGWRTRRAGQESIQAATRRAVSTDLFVESDCAVLVADAPVFLGRRLEAVLRMGFELDAAFAAEVRRLTGAELAILGERGVVVSTWNEVPVLSLDDAATAGEVSRLLVAGSEFFCVAPGFEGIESGAGFTALLGRSADAELAPLHRAERLMMAVGLGALLIAIVAGVAIAFGVTGPLHELVRFADRIREGDYAVPVPQSGRDEVGLLACSLENSRRALQAHVTRLEDLDRRRGEFISLAGHELRTPLTVVTSFNDMLHEGGFGELPDEVTETTAMIGEQLRRLNDLVTDILDLTALEAAPEKAITVAEFDLVDVVDGVDLDQKPMRAERNVDVRWHRPNSQTVIAGDERLVARAVRALLDNAIRFTQDGGRVDIELHEVSGEARLSISDDGIGIDPDDMRWIYDKLFEAGSIENHSSGQLEFQSGGMGLGLSLTRAVLEAHQGRLTVESEPGQGSRFEIAVPLATTGQPGTPPPVPHSRPEEPSCTSA